MTASPFLHFAESPAYRDAASIVDVLTDAGHLAYLAGGCVRDALLGQEPKDYDVATSAPPDAVKAIFRRTQGVGESFGVVLVRQPSSHVEVATFRTDGDYTDGRRPDHVTFSNEIDDARRRDFTINGMFFEPRAGRVIDHVGGQADLEAGIVRAIGDPDARLAEDYLRILRAIRFAARLDFAIEPLTRDAIVRHAGKLTRIAPERIADELRRMLTAPSAANSVEFFDACGVTSVLFRRVDGHLPSSAVETRSTATLRALGQPISFSLALVAIAVTRSIGAGATFADLVRADIVRRVDVSLRETLRYSNDESAAVRGTLAVGAMVGENPPSVATLKRFLAGPHAADALRLMRVFADSVGLAARLIDIDQMIASFAGQDVAPPPFVTGDDLTGMGFTPSPKFKRVLDATYDEQLERRVTSPETARAFARRLMER